MDALIEFSQTGDLGPLRKGMTAVEVVQLLGPPDSSRWIQGDDNVQRYRYGSLSLRLRRRLGDPAGDENLLLHSLRLSFDRLPFELPEPVASRLEHRWLSTRLDDVLAVFHQANAVAVLDYESVKDGEIYQRYRVGERRVSLNVFDGEVVDIEG
ncbi:hypothetical protein [Micromonospora sp. CPCC 206061]|uniref:hypothetical protein n=1 Tax=Micromonospora sp. CPCC 206061 TaxID=3122410 RepID=UPI002FEFB919